MSAPLIPQESERLAALQRFEILDTDPEQAFDDLTLLAAQICQVPTALVSFVDADRQWFKSRRGMPLTETPRDVAFCAHTILHSDRVLEIQDAQVDPRFVNNPLVAGELGIRFYAGAPLVASDGHSVGALCVMDRAPRTLSDEQRKALQALSRHVVSQLELRRQTTLLAREVIQRERAEQQLRTQCDQLAASEQTASRHLQVAEESRHELLRVLEDEKTSVAKLRESEARFRQLAENINEVFWMTDPGKNTILYISPAYENIWGRPCRSLYEQPRNWIEAIHPDDRARVADAAITRQVRGEYDEIYRILRPDGSQRWVRDRAFPVRNERGEVYRMVGTAEDITDRKQAELRATVQYEVTAVLAEGAPLLETAHRILGIICRRMDWLMGDLWITSRATSTLRCVEIWHPEEERFRAFADASRRSTFTRGEGLPGRTWETCRARWVSEVMQDPEFHRREEAAGLGLTGAIAYPITLRHEVYGVVEFFSRHAQEPDAQVLALFAGFGTQIGQFIERKQLEDQFRQAQKMEAIGTLAGGIAHDFNNVLAAITGYTELAKMEAGGNAELSEYLQAVSKGSARAADLVRQILAFSRLQEQQRKAIPLWPILEEALKLLRATIPATIAFEASLVRNGPTVLADPTQIHQVVMNLATNAAHAMRERPGRLAVTLENLDVDADLAAAHPGLRAGKYQRLTVSDTGEGMDAATLGRIFDPFFTTKGPGEGTGLGLAVVHGIMQSHDGVITVYSQPGQGTRFHLYFPAHSAETTEVTADAGGIPLGRGQRVLLVDDEKPLASMGKRILERLGYVAETFTSPAEALKVFRSDPERFDLLVTDLTMPGMTGTELSDHALQVRPDLPVILTTGYSATLTPEKARGLRIRELLLKPLTIQALGESVHRVLTVPVPDPDHAAERGSR